MKQFLSDIVRGVLVGLLVGYMIRPDAKIFVQIENVVENSGEIVEEGYFDLLMRYAPEYILMDTPPAEYLLGGGVGALFGLVAWLLRRNRPMKKAKPVNRQKTAAARKKRKRPRKN